MNTRASNAPSWLSRWIGERGLLLFAVLLGASLIAAACSDDDGDDADSAAAAADAAIETLDFDFMAGFRAQANLPFVAVYVADQQGFFDDVGLNVDIKHAALGTSEHIQLVAAGEIDLTTQPASEVIQRRSGAGVPLVAIALFGQRGDLGYAVLEDSDIASTADFSGKTVGVKGVVQSEFLALLQEAGLRIDDVNLVDVGFNPAVLSEGEVDVY
ncbi:MAG TPA: ABC transporter substrate-binding protein, partial [Dehalococcoidia bacterium]|nr:ABC transporter substrate-binding protein [Dehalococcoidia bacterium]